MYLSQIRETVSKFAKTISNILDTDVMIIDNNYNRIANTYRYPSEPIDIKRMSILGEVLHTGKVVAVKDKRTYKYCKDCPDLEECEISGLIGVPILYEGKVIGAISLLSPLGKISPAIEKTEESIDFLIRMADLLSSKLKNVEDYNKLNLMMKEREILLNNIEDGLVFINNEGEIVHFNNRFVELFDVDKNIIGKKIENVIDHPIIHDIVLLRDNVEYKPISYQYMKQRFDGLVSYDNIITNGIYYGGIFTFKSFKKVYNLINEVSSGYERVTFADILGKSPSLLKEINKAKQLAVTDEIILIHNEPGLQETILARAIHNFSNRYKNHFICVDCASIPHELMEYYIFGAEGEIGAISMEHSPGKIRIANGGTIFFKNISKMPLHVQKKLVEMMKNNKNSSENVDIDIKMIFYSSENLLSLVKRNYFNEELYYRISKNVISIPPVSYRKEDIGIIIDKVIEKMKIKHKKPYVQFHEKVLDYMKKYRWPNNIDEIEKTIDRIMFSAKDKIIKYEDVKEYNFIKNVKNKISSIEEMEKELIIQAILTYESKEKVAEALGIGRATLYRKLKKYGIE